MGITQNALTANFTHMLYEQSAHIADVVQHAKQHEARCLEPTPEAEAEWVETIQQKATQGRISTSNARPVTTTTKANSIRVPGFVGGLYDGGPIEFHELIRKWRSDGELKGLKFS